MDGIANVAKQQQLQVTNPQAQPKQENIVKEIQ